MSRQIWFTPWCSVREAFQIGPVTVTPGERVLSRCSPPERESLTTIFEAHKEFSGDPVPTPAVLVRLEDPLAVLEKEEEADVFEAARVLTFLGLSSNDYFFRWGDPLNATHFTLMGQNFRPGSTGLALTIRRRNGHTLDGGHDYKMLKLLAPSEASPQEFDGGPSDLRAALNKTWGSPFSKRLRRAFWWYERANTDSPVVPVDAEVKLVSTAYEVLAIATVAQGKKAHIRDMIGDLLNQNYVSRPGWKGQVKTGSTALLRVDWTTFQFWWNDFFDLRNSMEHEGFDNRPPERKGESWNRFQHLLVATALFPFLVRGLLGREGTYSWTEDDRRKIELLDHVIRSPGFRWDSTATLKESVAQANAILWKAKVAKMFESGGN